MQEKNASTMIENWCKRNNLTHYSNEQLDYLFENIQWISETENFDNFDLLKDIIETSKKCPYADTPSNNLLHYIDMINLNGNIKNYVINNLKIEKNYNIHNIYKFIHHMNLLSKKEVSIIINFLNSEFNNIKYCYPVENGNNKINVHLDINNLSSSLDIIENNLYIILFSFKEFDSYDITHLSHLDYYGFKKLIKIYYKFYKNIIHKEDFLNFIENNNNFDDFSYQDCHTILNNFNIYKLFNNMYFTKFSIKIINEGINNNIELMKIIKLMSLIQTRFDTSYISLDDINFKELINNIDIIINSNYNFSLLLFHNENLLYTLNLLNSINNEYDLYKFNYYSELIYLYSSIKSDKTFINMNINKLIFIIIDNFTSKNKINLKDYIYFVFCNLDRCIYTKYNKYYLMNLDELILEIENIFNIINNYLLLDEDKFKLIDYIKNNQSIIKIDAFNTIHILANNQSFFTKYIKFILDNNISFEIVKKWIGKDELFERWINQNYQLKEKELNFINSGKYSIPHFNNQKYKN